MFAGTSSSKRRRTSMSSSASKDDDAGSVDMEYQGDSKRKRTIKMDPIEQCQQLYDIVRNYKKEDGALLCEPFIRVPKRRQEPAYYEVVSNPMDMQRIQQKIKMDEYEDVEQMSVDFDLMLTNAKAFYKKSTSEHRDAIDLWDIFIEHKCKLFDRDSPTEDGKGKIILKMGKLARRAAAAEARKPTIGDADGETSESSTATDKDRHEDSERGDSVLFNQLEELFSHIINAKDVDDRPLHTVFTLLPSRKKYPSYYDVIDTPIDLKTIAMRIQSDKYTSLAEMEKDLIQMCRNACNFNEPGSQIYKDAKTLKKVIASKKYEIEHGRVTGYSGKTSERIRNRRLRSGTSHSAVTAALQYEDDEEEEEDEEEEDADENDEEAAEEGSDEDDEERVEDEEEDEEDEEGLKGNAEDPMWVLFESVSTYQTPGGILLADPFRRLPSRRFYPDYYNEIKNPISLAQIKTRILKNEYVNLTQVQADMNVMFENAKAYNMPDSTLYKSAVKLQKLVQSKVQELLGPEGDEESSNDDIIVSNSKRNVNSTPLPTLSMEGDFEMDDARAGAEEDSTSTPTQANTSNSSSKTPGSAGTGKRKPKVSRDGIANSGTGTGATVMATTVPPPRGSPTKLDEKNQKQAAYREQLKKRFQALYQALADYKDPVGLNPTSLFLEKPSKKLYPDYYRVIMEPIDMLTIKANIEADKYTSCEEVMRDFKLMFNNCRQYNEEGSSIYEDANRLEKALNEKMRFMGPDPAKPKLKKKKNPMMLLKQKKLLDTVRDYKDKNGRILSTIFQKLPSKNEYAEYYEIIKNPMDLERIGTKHRTGSYDSIEQLSADLMLMFDNACKFNEPDSQIYKDALILQRLVLQTKLSLASEDDGVPDVPGAVKGILISIFTSVYNHQDEEGRCFTDTMAELQEFDEVEGTKVRALSLDMIKSRLDRGYYKRLDIFQRDMFHCFERARRLSRTDSQVFEDSIELQSYFIKTRDDICKEGAVLKSTALNYKLLDLEKSVEIVREEKKSQELPQEEDVPVVEVKKEDEDVATSQVSMSESYNEQTYSIGDFIYVTPSNATAEAVSEVGVAGEPSLKGSGSGSSQANIANIQKLWTAPDGTKWFEGIWFFRPDQTYHIPTRKFLEKEVFRSEVRSTAKLSEIVGKCWVMTVKGKEYFNHMPEGYVDDDLYVCEYRYSSRGRSFTKMKTWGFSTDRVKLIPREKPLEPIRVASVFRERVEKHKEELQLIEDDLEKAPAEQYPNIELPPVPGKDELQPQPQLRYFEQFGLVCGPIRTGDFVYVRVEDAKKLVARVDSMWADANGTTFFHGPWFTSLSEVSPQSVPPGRIFYKQEIFQSSIEDTNPLLSICGKCCVLELDEYAKLRPTEVSEIDVFVCESLYDEARRQIKKFEGLKKYYFTDERVHKDEIFYFRRPITLTKVDMDGTVIPEMPKLKAAMKFDPGSPLSGFKFDSDSMLDDSMDGYPPSLGSNSETTGSVIGIPIGPSTPSGSSGKKSGKTPGKKLVTGYILYSSEVRRGVSERNPNSGFGEISRMVGADWKKLSKAEKTKYEDKAVKINEEKEAAIVTGLHPSTIGPGSQKFKETVAKQEGDLVAALEACKKDPDWIYECLWFDCEQQFEDAVDLVEHVIPDRSGHVAKYFKDSPTEGEFECKWRSCGRRLKKGVNPFPTLARLMKHVREIHFMKGNGRVLHPEKRGVPPAPAVQIPRPTTSKKGAEPSSLSNSKAKLPSSSSQSQTMVNAGGIPTMQPVQQQVIVRAAPPPEPLFVSVPPRPQKLLHSEAYIRYIESLHVEKRSMGDWEKTLRATQETTRPVEEAKLPAHWLANGQAAHENVTTALWALRNSMLRDSLNLHRYID